MKTQDQKHNDKFSKRIARWWNNFSIRIAQWWINVVDWAEDIDLGEILMNLFLILLIAGGFFGFAYFGIHHSHKNKTENSDRDTVAVVEEQVTVVKKQCSKSCAVDWDLDTTVILAPNKNGYRFHFKGKVPYYVKVDNLDDTIQ